MEAGSSDSQYPEPINFSASSPCDKAVLIRYYSHIYHNGTRFLTCAPPGFLFTAVWGTITAVRKPLKFFGSAFPLPPKKPTGINYF